MSLTIPSQVRGSDYSLVDNFLEPRPSIWRLNETGYKLISENGKRQEVPGIAEVPPLSLNDGDVLSFNFSVMLQMDIQAGDVLGFRLMELGDGGRIEHLPLLYKPGPTPGNFTPIIIANFNPTIGTPPSKPSDVLSHHPTSDTTSTKPSDVLSPSSPSDSEFKSVAKGMCLWKVTVFSLSTAQLGAQTSSVGFDVYVVALAVLFALALLVITALIVAVVVLVVMLKRKQAFSKDALN